MVGDSLVINCQKLNESERESLNRYTRFYSIMVNNRFWNNVLYSISFVSLVLGIFTYILFNNLKIISFYLLTIGVFVFVFWTIYKMIQNG